MKAQALALALLAPAAASGQGTGGSDEVGVVDPALYGVITASKDDEDYFYGRFIAPRVVGGRSVNYEECGGAVPSYRWVRPEDVEPAASVTDCDEPPTRWAGTAPAPDDVAAAGPPETADGGAAVVTEFATADLAGAPVFDPQGVEVGVVDGLVVGEGGVVGSAVIGLGGFLGIGERTVSVPFDSLTIRQSDDRLQVILDAAAAPAAPPNL